MARDNSIVAALLAGVPPSEILEDSGALATFPELTRVATFLERRRHLESVTERRAEWHLGNLRQLRRMRGARVLDEMRGSPDPTEFFERYYFRNEPVIIRNLKSGWWPFDEFTFEKIRSAYGGEMVSVFKGRMCGRQFEENVDQFFVDVRLGEFLSCVQSGPSDMYLIGQNRGLEGGLLGLSQHLRPLEEILDGDFRPEAGLPSFWIGPSGTITNLHFDISNVLNILIEGSKRFILVPSDNTCFVYNSRGIFSEVDAKNPDTARHPLFSRAERFEVVLAPGDAIFIPVGWWHYVESLEPSISIAFNRFVVGNTFSMPTYLLNSLQGVSNDHA